MRDQLATVLATLDRRSRITTCGTASGEVLAHYDPGIVDLVLLGTHPGQRAGLITLRALLATHPRANVLAFGAPDDTKAIAATVALGARGYLRWDAARPPMVATLAHAVTAHRTLRPAPSTSIHDPTRLSEREHQVLFGMSEGKTNGEIGRELFLSEDTIKTHARRMFRKLSVGDRAEAVAHGFRHHLLP